MKLFYNDASPFARKCRIVLRIKGLLQQCDEIVSIPMSNPPELLAVNPIAQVPALFIDYDNGVFNSPLICAYFDKMSNKNSIYGDDELKERRFEAIGDAISEMAVKIRMEQLRPQNEQSPNWILRWNDNLKRILLFANDELNKLEINENRIGTISIVCAMSYLSFRFSDLEIYDKINNLINIKNNIEQYEYYRYTYPK